MIETLKIGTTEVFLGRNGDACIDLCYPRIDGNTKFINVGLVDVRAADTIRISYDFERDGYSIQQASKFEWDAGDTVCDPDWQEVAFIQSWGREGKDNV